MNHLLMSIKILCKKKLAFGYNILYSLFMITLPATKIWTGDGYGAAYAHTMTLIKRSVKHAIFERKDKHGTIVGYEVFRIKIIPKGTEIYGTITEDDAENYPSQGSFGKTAWFVATLTRANELFTQLESELVTLSFDDENESAEIQYAPVKRGRKKVNRTPLVYPVGEFSVKCLAEHNKVDYSVAFVMMKEDIEKHAVQFVREQHLGGRGKPTKFFKAI